MNNPKSIRALFALPGFTAASKLVGVFGDRYARVIKLKRRKKQPSVLAVLIDAEGVTTKRSCEYATFRLLDGVSIWSSNVGASIVRGAARCM